MTADAATTEAELLAIVADPASSAAAIATAREELVRNNLPFVRRLAWRYRDRGESMDDLIQVGTLGLLKAIDRYDASRGAALRTFATPTVLGEIRRHFRDRGWGVKVPRRVRELSVSMRPVRERLTHELGRPPTADELASALNTEPERVLEVLQSAPAYAPQSLDQSRTDDGRTLAEVVGSPDAGVDEVLARETLRPALATLDPRLQRMLYLRYFENKSQSQIADELGISQVHVSRLLTKALRTLREHLGDPG